MSIDLKKKIWEQEGQRLKFNLSLGIYVKNT